MSIFGSSSSLATFSFFEFVLILVSSLICWVAEMKICCILKILPSENEVLHEDPPPNLVQQTPTAEATTAFDQISEPCQKGRKPFLPDDKVLRCPYDESHIILRKENLIRFKNHLKNCREKHPNTNLVVCPWFYFHHIPREALQDHLQNW